MSLPWPLPLHLLPIGVFMTPFTPNVLCVHPQENPTGYDDNSPLNYAHLFKGNYLLIHGSGDDNVHVQNTMRMVEALVQANKQFEWMIYPDKNHGIYGGNTSRHLYEKMTTFIENNL